MSPLYFLLCPEKENEERQAARPMKRGERVTTGHLSGAEAVAAAGGRQRHGADAWVACRALLLPAKHRGEALWLCLSLLEWC